MSFILDALRKSEHERERSALPGISDAPIVKPPPSKLPWILGGVGLLLVLNVIVLLVVLLRPAKTEAPTDAADARAPAASPAPGSSTVPAGATTGATVPEMQGIPGALPVPATAARDVRPLTAEADGADAAAEPLDVPPIERDPTLYEDAAPAVIAPPRTPRPAVVRAAEPPVDAPARELPRAAPPARTTGVPSIDDLAPQATAGLPQLSINLHVYSSEPAQRFVMLNGRRYVDGAQLQEGPTLERITPDGVILNHRGLRFLLPRP